ncbi:MAG: hypothetical protein WKF92_12965 [Pyrinomonadaceae bacterium]
MYRRSKFLEVLIEIRQEMAREADYDVDFFAEIARSGNSPREKIRHRLVDLLDAEDAAQRRAGKPNLSEDSNK